MRYLPAKEKDLLELLEKHDDGDGLEFSDHKLFKGPGYSEAQRVEYLANHDLDDSVRYHFDRMAQSGFVTRTAACAEWSTYELTLQGHERLESFRQNTLLKKIMRLVGGWLDKAMTSIFMPILVAVLTVFIMNYLGLNEASPLSVNEADK